jgi:hypothetical protein
MRLPRHLIISMPAGPHRRTRTLVAVGALVAATVAVSAQARDAHAQPTPPRRVVPAPFAPTTDAVARELSGERAFATVAYVEQFFRLPGNDGFDASIDSVRKLLDAAGFVPESRATPRDRLTYRVESRPMPNPAWTPLGASLTLPGRARPLLEWSTNRNMVAMNSWPTPPGGVTAGVVDVGAGAEADFDRIEVRGRIVLGDGNGRTLSQRAMARGAVGVLAAQQLPAYNRPDVNTTAIQYLGIARDTVARPWVVYLSRAARDSVRRALAAGDTTVRVDVRTRFDVRPELTLVAELRGARAPAERFVYSAHVQEAGANDNASGVGLLAEMARTTATLFRAGRVDPARTLTFLWGDEIRSTQRYLQEDSARRAGVKWGMSLDMVGENTALTGGTFLIEKMPDPSAVWVRGEDQHSEWGGRPLARDAVRPHWLNDFVRQRCLDRAAVTGWVVKANPFEGGSDHTPFLNANIPAVLLWHFTDQFYHTDRDRIEMVSTATLANVGNCALTTGLLLTDGRETVARAALDELVAVAEREATTQRDLSLEALRTRADTAATPERERLILATWRDYYLEAARRIPELTLSPPTTLATALAAADTRIRAAYASALSSIR